LDLLPVIDTGKFSAHLRRRGLRLDSREVLITKFNGSKEAEDFTLPPNCQGFGRIHHFRRFQGDNWPSNSLPIDPARKALQLPSSDMLQVQVFQNAICSWRCWYCFVDFDLLSANPRFSEFKTCEQILDLYSAERDRPLVIDLSGGQPDLVPEWGYWFYQALMKRGLSDRVYLWTDDNLSNDYLWRFLNSNQISELARASHYGRVGCFKGYDPLSFSFNTKAAPELFNQQFHLMRRLVDSGFDVFGYVTLTNNTDSDLRRLMRIFIDKMQEEVHELFPLRTIPLKISKFSPTKGRMTSEEERAIEIQSAAVTVWSEELGARFSAEVRKRSITEQWLNNR
jgi:uncharacterized Fe-S cluster-containing radical SAM superfamily protein